MRENGRASVAQMRPFSRQIDLLETIPGVGRSVAEIFIAESGGDMRRFPTAGHFASWAGSVPVTMSPPGSRNPAIPATATPGWAVPRAPPRWRQATPPTLTSPPTTDGSDPARNQETIVAIQHSIVIAAWHMLTA